MVTEALRRIGKEGLAVEKKGAACFQAALSVALEGAKVFCQVWPFGW